MAATMAAHTTNRRSRGDSFSGPWFSLTSLTFAL
jgi:hypothetical protein